MKKFIINANDFGLSRHASPSAKAVFLSLCCARVKARVKAAGFVIVDRFYGISNSGRMTAADLRRRIARRLISCHGL
jgi:hypothetical protein